MTTHKNLPRIPLPHDWSWRVKSPPILGHESWPHGREIMWRTSAFTFCGQFLGSGKRFEYESIARASTGETLVWSSSKDIITAWQKSGYESYSNPKNWGPKSLNQHTRTNALLRRFGNLSARMLFMPCSPL